VEMMIKQLNNDEWNVRTNALKLSYDAISHKIFSQNRQHETDEQDIKDLFELADYNYRFITGQEPDVNFKSPAQKIRERIKTHNL